MHRYFSTFQAGLYEIVKLALKEAIPDVKIEFYKEDLVVYSSSYDLEYIKNLPFFNNSFLAIKLFTNANVLNLDSQIDWALNSNQFAESLLNFRELSNRKFRIVLSQNNQMVPGDKHKLKQLIKDITDNTGLVYDPLLPDYEIWFFQKREGYGICGIRITKKSDYQSVLERGELRPELCYLINFLADPDKEDVYLDPFCGTGALPLSRAKYFEYKEIIASDIDIKRIQTKLSKPNERPLNFIVLDQNVLDISNLHVDKIVTDPPWGISESLSNTNKFYQEVLEQFNAILKNNGLVVLLVSSKIELGSIMKNTNFKLEEKYKTYVGGQEVYIYKLRKLNEETA